MNEFILNMYVVAVETGRFTIDFVPIMYRSEVSKRLNVDQSA